VEELLPVCGTRRVSSKPSFNNKKEQVSKKDTCSFLAMGYEKNVFAALTYEFELSHKSRHSRVYQSLRKKIQPAADDIHHR